MYPQVNKIRDVSLEVAVAVAEVAINRSVPLSALASPLLSGPLARADTALA